MLSLVALLHFVHTFINKIFKLFLNHLNVNMSSVSLVEPWLTPDYGLSEKMNFIISINAYISMALYFLSLTLYFCISKSDED